MAISSEMSSAGTSARSQGHRSTAFLIEALVVLAFLMVALAIFVQLFSKAQIMGVRANQLSEAVLVATNYAEEFSANPTGVDKTFEQDGLVATCEVKSQKHDAGTLYEATITVASAEGKDVLYTLNTARYVDSADAAANRGANAGGGSR